MDKDSNTELSMTGVRPSRIDKKYSELFDTYYNDLICCITNMPT